MSSLAAHIILHPTATQLLKVLSSTQGRDKIYRAIQNFARFYAWLLIRYDHKNAAVRWSNLKSTFGLGRKMMRLGKPLEHLQAALKAAGTHGPVGEQILGIGRQLAYAGYLTNDALVWAEKIKFIQFTPEVSKQVNQNANRFWLVGIASNLILALIKSGRYQQELRKLESPSISEKDIDSPEEREIKIRNLAKQRSTLRYQFVIDALDIWSPASNLDLVDLNDGVIGVFGTVTSLMAVRKLWVAAQIKK